MRTILHCTSLHLPSQFVVFNAGIVLHLLEGKLLSQSQVSCKFRRYFLLVLPSIRLHWQPWFVFQPLLIKKSNKQTIMWCYQHHASIWKWFLQAVGFLPKDSTKKLHFSAGQITLFHSLHHAFCQTKMFCFFHFQLLFSHNSSKIVLPLVASLTKALLTWFLAFGLHSPLDAVVAIYITFFLNLEFAGLVGCCPNVFKAWQCHCEQSKQRKEMVC